MSHFPYPGLRPFERDEIDIFFGREDHVNQLITRLGQTHFLAVIGLSGCGKSSLVRTGLLADLETGFLASAGVAWQVAELRPGNHPFAQLATALLETTFGENYLSHLTDRIEAAAFLQAQLRRIPLGLYGVLQETPLPAQTNLLLFVDQFEEIFRYHQQGDADEAETFVELLLASSQPALWSESPNRVYVVITMRSDFLGNCTLFHGLPEAINTGQFLTPRLNREQLREAIVFPARVFGGDIEDQLVNQLLNDAGDDFDQLPLLQHALMRIWNLAAAENQQPLVLTLKHYEQIGGLKQALSRHADEAYAELDLAQQKTAEILFRSLTERSSEYRDIRRPVKLAEIATLANVSWQQVATVVERFRQAGRHFLTPPLGEPLEPESVLDISHESFIRQWQRLKRWTEQEIEFAQFYQRLEDNACRWQKGQSALWRTPDLENALTWREQAQPTQAWASRYGTQFDLAIHFLEESQQKHEQEQQQLQAAQQQELKRARNQITRLVFGIIIAISLALWGYGERNKSAQSERERTRSLFESQLTHAVLLARDEDYAQAKKILRLTQELDIKIPAPRRHARNLVAWFCKLQGEAPQQVYQGANAQLFAVAVSPDGQTLAAAGENGTLVLFDTQTGQKLIDLKGHKEDVLAIRFHPQHPWLISAGEDQQIIRWSITTDEPPLKWRVPHSINTLALSSDGSQLASVGEDNHIILWHPATGSRLKSFKTIEGEEIYINDLAFSPNGNRLVSATSDNNATLWDLVKRQKVRTFSGHTGEIWGVTFSPSGTLLATSSEDNSVRLWKVATGKMVRVLRGHQNAVFRSQFIEDGRYLISASQDRTLRIWDTESGVSLRVLQGHTAGVTALAIHHQSLFSASYDGQIMRWQVALPNQKIVDLPSEPASVAIAPDGQHVAVGFANGKLSWYSLPEVQLQWQDEQAHTSDIQRLRFNSTGNLLASASFDKTAKLWQVRGNELIEQQTFTGHSDAINALAFSPDSQILATASYDGRVGLFNIGHEQAYFHQVHANGFIYSVNFDSSGTQLLTAGADGYTRLWNIAQNYPPVLLLQTFPKAQDEVMWASFSPDDQQVAMVGRDWLAHIYSIKDQLSHRFIGHEQTIHKVAFTPDSHQVVTASGDATVRLWDLVSKSELFTLHLPTSVEENAPLWDFDFRCVDQDCWIAVPLTSGKLVLYQLKNIYN